MGRLTTMIICGKDCEDCMYGVFDESNKARVRIYCQPREKWYYYGQCIPCDQKQKIKGDDLNEG